MKNRPVVVGIGDIQQKDQFDNLDEALILMEKASIKAIKDCENSEITKYIDEVQIPKGFWKYRDPGKWIAEKNNFPNVTTTVSKIGILQQSLINDACKKIIDGKIKACLIVGGEARYKRIKAQIENKNFIETELNENPDFYVKPSDDLNINIEIENLGTMAVGYYAILESAFRCMKNKDFHEHHKNIANVYSKFSKIAKVNKMGWLKESFTSEDILNSSKRNPQMAFPYNKLHCTSWNVNQAAAMILCSEELADKLNINAKKRIYPLASSENNHMIPTLLRQNLFESYGLNLAAKFILDVCKKNNLKPTYYDLYSCFPAAVQMFAEALRIKNISSTSLTGGMSFAGGPLNSYVINSTVQLFKKIRENRAKVIFEKYGKVIDIRSPIQVQKDLREKGTDVSLLVTPYRMIENEIQIFDENDNKDNSEQNFQKIIPLSGLSKKLYVGGSETGEYKFYTTDRYGFNNQDDDWVDGP